MRRVSFVLISACFFWPVSPHAVLARENTPSEAQRQIEKYYLPKVNVSCGLSLSVQYDEASLREHNEDIRFYTTDGHNDCNEPLRYLWYVCKSDPGRAAVKAARIERVVCKGTSAPVGSLQLRAGTITVERSENEKSEHAFERARKSFESQLHVAVKFDAKSSKDPSSDAVWRDLIYEPNPTTSETDYCIVDGNKQAYVKNLMNNVAYNVGAFSCWQDGKLVADVKFDNKRPTGFWFEFAPQTTERNAYRDGKRHGEQQTFRGALLEKASLYRDDQLVWKKEFHPNGKLHRYSRGRVGFTQTETGKITDLSCAPDVGDEVQLRELCGFEGEISVKVYDGDDRVTSVDTWKNGVMQKQRAGISDFAERSDADYRDGRKHGVERVLAPDGKLARTISWNHGVKDGKEQVFGEHGTKLIKEVSWSAGELKQVTEYYLNGRPKVSESYASAERKEVRAYWDSGELARQGALVSCSRARSVEDWCEDGLHRSYFENGSPEAEATFELGKRNGPAKSWWPNGKLASVEEYVDNRRAKARRWDQRGQQTSADEYEADGSRKVR